MNHRNQTRIVVRKNNEACVSIRQGLNEIAITQLHTALLDLLQCNHSNTSPSEYRLLGCECPRDKNIPQEQLHYYAGDDYDEGMRTYSHPFYICDECDDHGRRSTKATIFFNLGIAYSRLGDDSEALTWLEGSFRLQCMAASLAHQRNAIDGPALYMILHNIGFSHWRSKSYTEAVDSYSRALDLLVNDCPDLHRLDISCTLNCISVSKFYAGETNTNTILTIFERALALRLECSKVEHDRQIATIINNTGRVRLLRGEFDVAFAVCEEAYKQRVTILGADHSDVAMSLANMAQAKEHLGHAPEAIVFYKQFLEIALVKRGAAHNEVITVLLRIGDLSYRSSNLEEAYDFFSRALNSIKLTDQPCDETLAHIYNNLGNVLFDQRKYDLALDTYKSGLQIERALYDKFHDKTATTLLNIARIYQHQRKPDQAIKFYMKALDRKRGANDHGAVAEILVDLGSVFVTKGEYDTAMSALGEAIVVCRKNKRNDSLLPSALNLLGLIHHKRGSFFAALSCFLEVIHIFKSFRNMSVRDVSNVYFNTAMVFREVGESEKALAYYKETLVFEKVICQVSETSGNEREIMINYEIGTILKKEEKLHEALTHLVRSSQMCLRDPTIINDAFTSKVLMSLCDLYIRLGDETNAMKIFTIAVHVCGTNFSGVSEIADTSDPNITFDVATDLFKAPHTNPPGAAAA